MGTEISGDRRDTELSVPDQEWLRDNNLPTDETGAFPYTETHVADLRAFDGWISLDEIRQLNASEIKAVLGDDGMFSALRDVDETIRLGSTPEHRLVTGYRVTSNIAIAMLENGHPPLVMVKRVRRDHAFSKVVGEADKMVGVNAYMDRIAASLTRKDNLDVRPDALDHDTRETGRPILPAARLIAQRLRDGLDPETIAVQEWVERVAHRTYAYADGRIEVRKQPACFTKQFV